MIVSELYDLSYFPGNHLFGRSQWQREKEKRIGKEFAHFKRKEASTSTSAEAGKLFILFFFFFMNQMMAEIYLMLLSLIVLLFISFHD